MADLFAHALSESDAWQYSMVSPAFVHIEQASAGSLSLEAFMSLCRNPQNVRQVSSIVDVQRNVRLNDPIEAIARRFSESGALPLGIKPLRDLQEPIVLFILSSASQVLSSLLVSFFCIPSFLSYLVCFLGRCEAADRLYSERRRHL